MSNETLLFEAYHNYMDYECKVISTIHIAVEKNNMNFLNHCVKIGIDIPEISSKMYISPLKIAISCNNIDMLRFLLDLGCDPNVYVEETSLLADALEFGYFEIASELLKAGFNINSSEDDKPLAIFDYLFTQIYLPSNYQMVAAISEEEKLAQKNRVDRVQKEMEKVVRSIEFLIENGLDLTVRNEEGKTPYEFAMDEGLSFLADLLKVENIHLHQ